MPYYYVVDAIENEDKLIPGIPQKTLWIGHYDENTNTYLIKTPYKIDALLNLTEEELKYECSRREIKLADVIYRWDINGLMTDQPKPSNPEDFGLPYDAVEIVEKRTRNSKTFKRKDGSYLQVFSDVLHYQPMEGAPWYDIRLEYREIEPGVYIADEFDLIVIAREDACGIQILDKNGNGIFWETGSDMKLIDNKYIQFTNNGLYWKHGLTQFGVKLISGPVTAPRGPYCYRWKYNIIGDIGELYGTPEGDLTNDAVTIKRPVVIGANGKVYECERWWVEPKGWVHFAFDDSILPPEAYPYIIDPSTTFRTPTNNDARIITKINSPQYPLITETLLNSFTGSWSTIRHSKTGSNYNVANCVFRVDISSLPEDANIVEVLVQITTSNTYSRTVADNKDIVVGIVIDAPFPFTTDMYTEYIDNVVARRSFNDTEFIYNRDVNIPVVDLAKFKNSINRNGYTTFILGLSGGEPTGPNEFQIATHTHSSSLVPRILIKYTYNEKQYYTDFEQFGQPSDWELGWSTSLISINCTSYQMAHDGMALEYIQRAGYKNAFVNVLQDQDSEVADVLTCISISSTSSNGAQAMGIGVRMAYPAINGYVFMLDYNNQAVQILRVASSGSAPILASMPYEIAYDTWYMARMYIYFNEVIYAKVWEKGDPEPTEWTFTVNISSTTPIYSFGKIGLSGFGNNFSPGLVAYIDYFGVGINGAPVPTGPVPNDPIPPNVEILYHDRERISGVEGMNTSTIKFRFDRTIDMFTIRRDGTSHDTGLEITTHDFTDNPQDPETEYTIQITWQQLNEGENRINIYGRSIEGVWTEYYVAGGLGEDLLEEEPLEGGDEPLGGEQDIE